MQSLLFSFYMATEAEVKEFFDSQIKCKYQGRVEWEYRSEIPAGECSGRYNYFVKNDKGYVFPWCTYLSNECVWDGICWNSNLTEIYWPEPEIWDYIYWIMNDSWNILRIWKHNYDLDKSIPDCKTYSNIADFYFHTSVSSESNEYSIYSVIFISSAIFFCIFFYLSYIKK